MKIKQMSIKLPHIEIGISVVALIVSVASMWFSLRTEEVASAPNVQLEAFEKSGRGREIHEDKDGKWVGETMTIVATIVLKNFGRADAQIVSIRCEPLAIESSPAGVKGWLAISDQISRLEEPTRHNFMYQFKENPVLGLVSPNIPSGSSRSFKAVFEAKTDIHDGKDFPNIRIVFILSNGQEITVLPPLDWVGVGSHF